MIDATDLQGGDVDDPLFPVLLQSREFLRWADPRSLLMSMT